MRAAILTLLLATASAAAAEAQASARRAGPLVPSFGEVYEIPGPDFPTPADRPLRAVWEVAQRAPAPDQVSPSLNSAARFLNMHAQAGVPRERLAGALVVHGPAGHDLLDDAAYRERFGVANPNLPLLRELREAGVRVILCGQTALSRDIPRDRLAPGVEVALSAMTALIVLQEDGYRLIPF